jgi:hypothetical protein
MKLRAGLVLVVALAASHCRDVPTGPTAGAFRVALAGAGAADRAILVEVAGTDTSARIDTIAAAAGSPYRVFAQRQTSTRWRVIVTGPIANGTLVQLGVPDQGKSGFYTGTVLDVANATFAVLAPGARAITVSP